MNPVIATAIASALVVVLPTAEPPPDPGKLAHQLEKDLARPGLTLSEPGTLPDEPAMVEALLAHPGECSPALSEELLADLSVAHPADGELYVATPFSSKSRETLVWRYDPLGNQLLRVSKDHNPAIPPSEAPGRLVFLDWPDAGKDVKGFGAVIGAMRADSAQSEGGWDDLLGEIMEHPNECTAPLSPGAQRTVADFTSDVDGDLVLAARPPGEKRPMAWRWDEDARELRRIFLP